MPDAISRSLASASARTASRSRYTHAFRVGFQGPSMRSSRDRAKSTADSSRLTDEVGGVGDGKFKWLGHGVAPLLK